MRNIAYIGAGGTLLAFIVTGFVQLVPVDEITKFLSWTVPALISIIGWAIQAVLTSKRLKKNLMTDLMKQVDEKIEKVNIPKIEDHIAAKVMQEFWLRIPTIIQLSKTPDEGPEDHKETKRKP